MIKKVNIEQLRPGIYIYDFGKKWTEHPFFTNKRKIASSWDIDRIREYNITEVYIDTSRGLDVLPVQVPLNEWTKAFENKKAEAKLLIKKLPWASFRDELPRAFDIRSQVMQFEDQTALAIATGQPPDKPALTNLAELIFKSLVRNHNALLSLIPLSNSEDYLKLRHFSVAVLMGVICRRMGFEPEQVKLFISGGLIYDCGMYALPEQMQKNLDPFDDQQKREMHSHTEKGLEILSSGADYDSEIQNMVSQHHERLDGNGYGQGLADEDISLGGRLVGLLDVYSALNVDRGYKSAKPAQKVYQYLLKEAAGQFDQELAKLLLSATGLYPVGSLVRLKSDFLAIVVGTPRQDLQKPKVMLIYNIKNRRVISPRILDLSEGIGHMHAIVNQESPLEWGLDIMEILKPGQN